MSTDKAPSGGEGEEEEEKGEKTEETDKAVVTDDKNNQVRAWHTRRGYSGISNCRVVQGAPVEKRRNNTKLRMMKKKVDVYSTANRQNAGDVADRGEH